GFGGIQGDLGVQLNAISGSLRIDAGTDGVIDSRGDALGGKRWDGTACGPSNCALALSQLGALTARDANGASRDFFLSVLKQAVRGADGLAFNLSNFSLSGPLTLSYAMPGGGASLSLSNLSLSRSDDASATFSDPYRLRVLRRDGLADVIRLTEPQNASGLLKWQFAADWRVDANGISHDGGALVLQDLVTRGGSLTLTTPATPGVEGAAFGLALNLEI